METVYAVIGGAAGAALISGLFSVWLWRLNHGNNQTEVELAICEALQLLLLDKIMYLGQKYIDADEVDFDDRRRLNKMHKVYHDGLHGNGDADNIMTAVNALPLKSERRAK